MLAKVYENSEEFNLLFLNIVNFPKIIKISLAILVDIRYAKGTSISKYCSLNVIVCKAIIQKE